MWQYLKWNLRVVCLCIMGVASAFPVLAFENCNSVVLSDLEKCSGNNYQLEDLQLNSLYNEALMVAEHKVYQNICLYEQTRDR